MTLILSGTDGLSDVDGSAATPAIRGTDANTGIFFGADIIGFSEGGTEVARFNADAQFVAAAGTASLPVITTTGDTNTGIYFPAADTIAFAEGGVESMRIDSSGNVGIGTSSPLSLGAGYTSLDIRNATTGSGIVLGTTTEQAGYIFGNANEMRFQAFSARYASFWTNSVERARIDSSGNLLVGGTSFTQGGIVGSITASVSGTLIQLSTNSTGNKIQMQFNNPNGQVGYILTNGSGTTYATSSDYRLKENIAPMTGALAKVSALKPVTYTWKVDGSSGQGFIAHELAEVEPGCVTGEKDAVDDEGNPVYQGIDTSFLVATLTAAIQELKALVDGQASTITALQAEVEALKGTA